MELSGSPPDGTRSSSPHSSNEDADATKFSKASGVCVTRTIEDENDLRQFLKVVRPDWSCQKGHGHKDIQRVMDKLKDIGVRDTWDLIRRVNENTINEDLSNAGHSRFSRDTVDRIRKQSSFIRSLEHTKESHYRQVGLFAPVPQMLASSNLFKAKSSSNSKKDEQMKSSVSVHPSTEPGKGSPKRREDRPGTVSALNAMGLGDHGGVYIRGSSAATTSESFASLLSGKQNSAVGALYLRNARPRHGRAKQSQSRPVTVCSLPDISKLHTQSFGSSVRASSAQYRHGNGGAFEYPKDSGVSSTNQSPIRGRFESDTSGVGSCSEVDSIATQHLSEWSKAGNQITKQRWVAKWVPQGRDSTLRRGEAMLREQDNLEDRRDLLRIIESEGDESPMRRHVATRIQSRLREERERDTQEKTEMQQRCINIRKSLGFMQAARRDLSEHKRKVQEALQEVPTAKDHQWAIAENFRKALT